MVEQEIARMQTELRCLREDMAQIKDILSKVDVAIERLARIEERHLNTSSAIERAFNEIKETKARVTAIEQRQPINNLVSDWAMRAVVAAVVIFIMLVLQHSGVTQ